MVTVSFFKFSKQNRWFAFKQMGLAHRWLKDIDGCEFYKLMGSGRGNGFSIFPDFSTYCLLMKWESRSFYKAFMNNNSYRTYLSRSERHFTVFLRAIKSIGTWDGVNPFKMESTTDGNSGLAVLTRATIVKRYIPLFWSKVPKASAEVHHTSGHIFSKGVGEVPLLHQATISIWESKDAMHSYAYQNEAHVEMIRKTREKGWYSEELFAEFEIEEVEGDIW